MKPALACATVVLLLCLGPVPLLGLAVVVLLAAALLPTTLDVSSRLFLAGVLAVCATALFALVPWLLSIRGSLVVPLPLAAAALGAGVASRGWRACTRLRVTWGAVAVGVLGIGFALVLFAGWDDRTDGGRLAVMLAGEDNSAHLGLVVAARDAGGYVYGADDEDLNPGLEFYPQGTHVAAGLVADLADEPRTPRASIRVYTLAVLGATVAMAVAIAVAALRLAVGVGASERAAAATAGVATLAVVGGPLMYLLQNGFFSQIWAYAFLATLVAVSVDPSFGELPRTRLVTIVLLGCAIASTYYFLLPVALVVAAPAVVRERRILLGDRRLLAAILLACGLGAIPVVVSLRSGAAGAINADGGVFAVDRALLMRVTVVAAVVALVEVLRGNARPVLPWMSGLAGGALFSAALLAQGRIATGSTSYYYEKSLYTMLLLSLIGCAAGLMVAIDRAAASSRMLSLLGPATTIAALLIASVQVRPATASPVYTHQRHAGKQDPAFDLVLSSIGPRDRPPVLWHYATPGDDFLATKMLSNLYHRGDDARRTFELDAVESSAADERVLLRYLRTEPDVDVITRDAGLAGRVPDSTRVILLPP